MKILGTVVYVSVLLGLATNIVHAKTENLRCRLMSKEISSTEVKVPGEHTNLSAFRDGGFCVFEDGRIANKEFVAANAAAADFSSGLYAGFSVYTFENGDSLTLSFTGAWGSDGNNGEYQVLRGTGAYEGATGSGTIGGMDSPWSGVGMFDIKIDVTTGE